jgi:phosphoribosylanthranilate isomerase
MWSKFMDRVRIKICGITRAQDALAAAREGADAIGMVFHKSSPRSVTPERAREILSALPPFVTPVGLFVDSRVHEVRELARRLGLRNVQLHGQENANYLRQLPKFNLLKAVRASRDTFAAELSMWREEIRRGGLAHFRGIVLETPAAAPGGTGLVNDWQFVRECQAQGLFSGLPPIIAAGGLTPTNVATVVRELRPYSVDVSSGVEESKGLKSEMLIRAFVDAVNGFE